MNSGRLVMCLLVMLSGEEVRAENVMLCTGSPPVVDAWGVSSALLNAKDILIGQTVTIRTIDRYQTRDQKLKGMKETDAVTLTFTPTDVIEGVGEEQSREPVTYWKNFWCRLDALEGKQMCYGIIKPWWIPKPWQSKPGQNKYAHVEVNDIKQVARYGISGPCDLWLVGRYEKLSVPENLDAQPSENPYRDNPSNPYYQGYKFPEWKLPEKK